MLRIRDLKPKRIVLIVTLLTFVSILTWLVIRLVTIDTTLNLVKTYSVSDLINFKDFYTLDNGDYAVAIDGNVVVGKSFNAGEVDVRPTASIAKLILSLAIMQEKPFNLGTDGEIITLSKEDYDRYIWYYNNNGSTTAVQIGEEISQYDALSSVLLASSNNMADSLAIWAFGSIDEYREYANNMLQGYGINNTTIGEDASGFHETTTSTTEDLARISAIFLENPVLAEIVNTKSRDVPIAGTINNTNRLLGVNNIIGIKTGYIGDVSGYCLTTGYKEHNHIITVALLGASTRTDSFDESLAIIKAAQNRIKNSELIKAGQTVGYYDSWWTGRVDITTSEDLNELVWDGADIQTNLIMDGENGIIRINIAGEDYDVKVESGSYEKEPSFIEKVMHIFGWKKESEEPDILESTNESDDEQANAEEEVVAEPAEEPIEAKEETEKEEESTRETEPFTNAPSSNCTIKLGALMLINPNFTVEEGFISARRGELVSISSRYGIIEGNPGNGDNLLDAEAAVHINDMVNAYKEAYPGHTLETRSCFRSKGTSCGRLCAATGASDHHTGLTCDLLDPAYGTSLDTDTYDQHIDWQWLKANSYKYGFIDRFPEAWAGGLMSEPLNVDENGSTGLFETWHYRYVGIEAAYDIATGKYNGGEYDSLEHYLKSRGLVTDLKAGKCYNN